jgi:signal transduction histidine kinase
MYQPHHEVWSKGRIAQRKQDRPTALGAPSERRNSEERLLVGELTHRMNNEFAAAIGVVSLAVARSPNAEVKSALAAVEERLHSFVQVNRCLQIPSQDTIIDASAHLRRLCQSIGRSRLDCRGIELQFVSHPLQMNSERCWRLGMIISELVTNAARHAFGDGGGNIQVELSQCGPFVNCRVADDGTAPEKIRPGRGFAIVERMIASLDGTIIQHFGPGGSVSDMNFPVCSRAPRTGPSALFPPKKRDTVLRVGSLEADRAYMNRVSMMGELAASLAHEIKQPIAAAAISAEACTQWLRRDAPDVTEASEAASATLAAVTRAGGIIDRVSSLYRRGTPERELVDLNEIVREMSVLLGDKANRNAVSIRTDLDPELPTTTADRVQLQQVLMNLMLNGIEAMQDAGGELTVASKRTEDGQLLVSVSDTGIGLSIDEAERIFEAFFTTKPRGTGMGLSISRRIIASHGGRLWESPNTGRGATFQFTLPVEATASVPVAV